LKAAAATEDGPAARRALTEFVFEFVRREVAPDQPSRLTVVFASASLRSLIWWQEARRIRGYAAGSFLELEAGSPGRRFDGQWPATRAGTTVLEVMEAAERYWRGEVSPTPLWEYLLPGPVRVLRAVDPTSEDGPRPRSGEIAKASHAG
jgi:hypothetical protein